MKAILISIKPKWCAKIMNGDKTIEIRKSMPKCDLPIDVYIYMTKNGGELFNGLYTAPDMNGRVIAKFTMKKCQEWHNYSWQEITKNGCVSDNELKEYSKGRKSLYIWHISDLEIFDKPKELSEFSGIRPNGLTYMLEKAPQSFCYVEVE